MMLKLHLPPRPFTFLQYTTTLFETEMLCIFFISFFDELFSPRVYKEPILLNAFEKFHVQNIELKWYFISVAY